MPKIVYFVASHVNPAQIVRLVGALRSGSPEAQVLIHHNYSVSYLDPKLFGGTDKVHILAPYVRVQWGSYSQITMLLRAIDWALDSGEFDWMVYISGQDYPIAPMREIERFLATTDYDGFASGKRADMQDLPQRVFTSWYFYHWYFYRFYKLKLPRALYGLKGALTASRSSQASRGQLTDRIVPDRSLPPIRVRYARSTRQLMLCIRRRSLPFSASFFCYHGPSWWTLSRRALQIIRQFVQQNPRYVSYYKRAHLPEESFFLTILLNSPDLKICPDNKRYIQWGPPPAAHPQVLTVDDFPAMVSSGKHFARKVNQEVDPHLLDMLDQHIGTEPERRAAMPTLLDAKGGRSMPAGGEPLPCGNRSAAES